MADEICNEVILVKGGIGNVRIRIDTPSVSTNGNYICRYEISTATESVCHHRYGATQLQAILLTLTAVADGVSKMLFEHGGDVEAGGGVWDDLRRVRTTPEEWTKILTEYTIREGLSERMIAASVPGYLKTNVKKNDNG